MELTCFGRSPLCPPACPWPFQLHRSRISLCSSATSESKCCHWRSRKTLHMAWFFPPARPVLSVMLTVATGPPSSSWPEGSRVTWLTYQWVLGPRPSTGRLAFLCRGEEARAYSHQLCRVQGAELHRPLRKQPRGSGFSFLRVLATKSPIPVTVPLSPLPAPLMSPQPPHALIALLTGC